MKLTVFPMQPLVVNMPRCCGRISLHPCVGTLVLYCSSDTASCRLCGPWPSLSNPVAPQQKCKLKCLGCGAGRAWEHQHTSLPHGRRIMVNPDYGEPKVLWPSGTGPPILPTPLGRENAFCVPYRVTET